MNKNKSNPNNGKRKIKDSAFYLNRIIQFFPDIIITVDHQKTVQFCNRALFDIPLSKTIGRPLLEIIGPDRFGRLAAQIENSIQNHNAAPIEYQDALHNWWTIRVISLKPEERHLPTHLIIFTNITKQKETELALQESEEYHRSLFINSPIKTIIVDHNGVVTGVNKQRAAVDQNSSFNRVPKIGDQMYTADFAGKHEIDMRSELLACIQTGKSKSFPKLKYKQKYLSVNITPYPYGAIITSNDITKQVIAEQERKQFEMWHLQKQKLEAVGTLASGIAHEFNNILWIINGNIDLASNLIAEGDPARYHLEQVENACSRAKDLVTQLIGFTKQSDKNREPLKISLVVKEILRLIRSSIPTTIHIKKNLSAEKDVILADLSQINQVLMNLCTNAYHAMQDTGGELAIDVLNIDIEEDDIDLYKDLHPGRYVLITISDTGHGIQPEFVDQIFDPFFTTKTERKSTGIGLSMVHQIIKNHQGAITVQSNVNKGTVFNIFLPCIKTDDSNLKIIRKDAEPTLYHEKILFVDDDQAIVDAARRMLERLGYEVFTAGSAGQALDYFQDQTNPFDVIFTDMTMPDQTGVDLAQQILQIDPDSKLILCTGFSTAISPEKAKIIGFKEFLLKPVTKNKIADTLRKVIENL